MQIWFYPFSQTMPIPREYRDSFGVGGVKNQISFLKFLSLTFSVKSYLFIFSLLLLLPSLEIEKWNDFSARNHSLKSQFPTFHLPHPRFRCEFHEGYNPLDWRRLKMKLWWSHEWWLYPQYERLKKTENLSRMNQSPSMDQVAEDRKYFGRR